jgi:hypothetical protein
MHPAAIRRTWTDPVRGAGSSGAILTPPVPRRGLHTADNFVAIGLAIVARETCQALMAGTLGVLEALNDVRCKGRGW